MVVYEDKFVITGSDDGGVRMWSVDRREQTLQFLVMNQVCFTLVQLCRVFVVCQRDTISCSGLTNSYSNGFLSHCYLMLF